jgi:hypothetical protein
MGDRAGVARAVNQNADYKKCHPGKNRVLDIETKSIHG